MTRNENWQLQICLSCKNVPDIFPSQDILKGIHQMQTILAVLRWLAARLLHHHTFNPLDEMCATFNSIQISNFSSSKFSFTSKTSSNFPSPTQQKIWIKKKLPNSPWLEVIFVCQGHLHFMPTSIMSQDDRLTQLVGRKHQHRLCTWRGLRGARVCGDFLLHKKKTSRSKKGVVF